MANDPYTNVSDFSRLHFASAHPSISCLYPENHSWISPVRQLAAHERGLLNAYGIRAGDRLFNRASLDILRSFSLTPEDIRYLRTTDGFKRMIENVFDLEPELGNRKRAVERVLRNFRIDSNHRARRWPRGR